MEKAEDLQLLNIRSKKDDGSVEVATEQVKMEETTIRDDINTLSNGNVDSMNDGKITKNENNVSFNLETEINELNPFAQEYHTNSYDENIVMTPDQSEDMNQSIENVMIEGHETTVALKEPDPKKKVFQTDPHIESLLAEVHSFKGFNHCPHSGCDYKAKRKELIRNHLSSTHGGPKFHCQYESCDRIYSNSGNLRSHTKSYHNCDKCTEQYEFNKDLRKHKKQHHPNPYIKY